MVAGGAIGRAVLEAYKEAAAGRGAAAAAAQKVARRRMSLDEAVKAGRGGAKSSRVKLSEARSFGRVPGGCFSIKFIKI